MLHDGRQRHFKWRGEFADRKAGLLREPHHQRAAGRVRQRGEGAIERRGIKLYHVVKYRRARGRVKRRFWNKEGECLLLPFATVGRDQPGFLIAAPTSRTPSSLAHSAGPAILPISQPDGSRMIVVGMPNALPAVLRSSNTRALGSEK